MDSIAPEVLQKMGVLREITVDRMRVYLSSNDASLAEALEIFTLKIDEVVEEMKHLSVKISNAIHSNSIAKDKFIQFSKVIDKLTENVNSLTKRSILTSVSSLNDKIKIWNLELSLSFHDLTTTISLALDDSASPNRETAKNEKVPQPARLAAVKPPRPPSLRIKSTTVDVDTAAPDKPIASNVLYEAIKQSCAELHNLLVQYVNALLEKQKEFEEDSRVGVIYFGITQLVAKIDTSLEEINANEHKILLSLSVPNVNTNAQNLHTTLVEFAEFFAQFDKLMYFKFSNHIKKKLQLVTLIFSSRCNHFLTSVCLNMNMNPALPAPQKSSQYYEDGIQYLHGIGVPKNNTLAYAFFLEGAESGDVSCMERVAQCYQLGVGVNIDIDAAQKWLQRGIGLGSSGAKCKLALLLITEVQGSDIDAEDREVVLQHALTLLFGAANEGYVEAMTNLGVVFEKAGNFEEAEKMYSKAASSGCCRALNLLGLLQFHGKGNFASKRIGSTDIAGEKKLAFLSFCASAKGGCANAYFNVGSCLEYGVGTEMDLPRAIASYRMGADLGCSKAMYSLGYLLIKQEFSKLHGANEMSSEYVHPSSLLYCNASIEEGIRYLRMAYELGVVEAAYQLGRVYEMGPQQDYKHSLHPYLWAAKRGHAKSAHCAANILYMYGDGSSDVRGSGGTTKYLFQALDLYRQAAEAGIPSAMNSLALLLESDDLFSSSKQSDYEEAAQWYLEAGSAGLEEAMLNLSLLLATGKLAVFYSFSGDEMTLTRSLEWLAKNAVLSEKFLPKFGHALRRIDLLSKQNTSRSVSVFGESSVNTPYKGTPLSSPTASTSRPAGSFKHAVGFEPVSVSSFIDDGNRRSARYSSSPARMYPRNTSSKASRAYSFNLDSPQRQSTLNIFDRDSVASSPYSGLRPLSKRYEALTTASNYDEFIDILAADEVPQIKSAGGHLIYDKAIAMARSHSQSIENV